MSEIVQNYCYEPRKDDMNKNKRKKISGLIDALKNVPNELSYLLDEEVICMTNMSESLKGDSFGPLFWTVLFI